MDRILIVDDEPGIIESLTLVLSDSYDVESSTDGFSALEKISQNRYDLMLLDIKMPRMDGLEVLEKAREIDSDLMVIMISGHGTIETAVDATRKGAFDFLEKPFDISNLVLKINNALELKKSKDEIRKIKNELLNSISLIGDSTRMADVRDKIKKFSDLDLNVLITGESGTGKMLSARLLHEMSARANEPFININCAALKGEKINEELFGVYGDNKILISGKFVEAGRGTILFDEISSLSLDVQAILYKVIEERKFSRTGENVDIKLEARLIFSTNSDIESLVAEGLFKEELYHRINVLNINMPSLRDISEDIPVLTDYFAGQICKGYNTGIKTFTDGAKNELKNMRYPGNVRELKNLIERLIFTIDKNEIGEEDIELPSTKHTKFLNDLMNRNMSFNEFQNESEKLFIIKMLNDYKYNISQTADALKIQRSHLYNLMNKYSIPLPSKMGGKQ
ncbi:MAG TPA: sigma-54 dependent transcriptional regulator [Ignavibacteria bacterium]|nr:sigma-54 dependent transcriptional regulator [Ignavibacteria bacterium]